MHHSPACHLPDRLTQPGIPTACDSAPRTLPAPSNTSKQACATAGSLGGALPQQLHLSAAAAVACRAASCSCPSATSASEPPSAPAPAPRSACRSWPSAPPSTCPCLCPERRSGARSDSWCLQPASRVQAQHCSEPASDALLAAQCLPGPALPGPGLLAFRTWRPRRHTPPPAGTNPRPHLSACELGPASSGWCRECPREPWRSPGGSWPRSPSRSRLRLRRLSRGSCACAGAARAEGRVGRPQGVRSCGEGVKAG